MKFSLNRCNLCGYPVIHIYFGAFGVRCIKCRSTFIHRAIGQIIKELKFNPKIQVYELSSSGALFLYLRKTFPYFYFSEYFNNFPSGIIIRGIRHENVQDLSFKDRKFDLVTSTEVFEHVEDDTMGFKEIFRVLKPDGYFIFTVPLKKGDTIIRIERIEGKLHFYQPPEYHNDRITGKGRVLSYRDYGQDIKFKLEKIGFNVQIRDFEENYSGKLGWKVIICHKKNCKGV